MRADESAQDVSVLSLPHCSSQMGLGGGSLHYCVSMSLAVLHVVSLSLVQKLFNRSQFFFRGIAISIGIDLVCPQRR